MADLVQVCWGKGEEPFVWDEDIQYSSLRYVCVNKSMSAFVLRFAFCVCVARRALRLRYLLRFFLLPFPLRGSQ